MKIFRGPRSTENWTQTDSRPLHEWAKRWYPGKKICLDGTIKKTGQRHTDLGIEINSDEILAMHDALVRYQKDRVKNLEETVNLLEEAMQKIYHLILYYRNKAPNDNELIQTLLLIADHFRWDHSRSKGINLDWIKWKDIEPS